MMGNRGRERGRHRQKSKETDSWRKSEKVRQEKLHRNSGWETEGEETHTDRHRI